MTDLVNTIKNFKLSSRIKCTLWAVVLSGILAHLYIYTNRIVNHDGVFALNYSGATITSGRWFLYLLCEISYIFTGNYITHWGIGCITIALYSLAACIIVLTFNIKSRLLCISLGSILITFPTVTSGNLYIFTAHYYAFAFLLICCSVFLVNRNKSILSILSSGILIALSLGIYQAYLPFALTMYVLLILFRCLDSKQQPGSICLVALRFLLSLMIGLILYFTANRFFLSVCHVQMSAYMGMDSMGSIHLFDIPSIIAKCYSNFFNLFFLDYCGINHRSWIKKVMLLLMVYFVAITIWKMIKQKSGLIKSLFILATLLVLPIAINAICIMSQDESAVNTLTTFASVFVLICPILISDNVADSIPETRHFVIRLGVLALLLSVSAYYSNLANETYLSLEYSNTNVNAYFNQLVTQIKSTEDFSPDMKVALIGEIQDETLPDIGCDYIIRGTFTPISLSNTYSRQFFISMHCGYECEFIKDTTALSQNIQVQDMPNYPLDGSIQIIDNIIVVKFS